MIEVLIWAVIVLAMLGMFGRFVAAVTKAQDAAREAKARKEEV